MNSWKSILSVCGLALCPLGPAHGGSVCAAAEPALAGIGMPPSDSASPAAAARRDLAPAAYREHAPLAWFSVGSLAVGGLFYAIGRDMDRPNLSYTAGDRSRIGAGVAAAGITALIAAGSYFYFAHRARSEEGWEAGLAGVPDGSGSLALGARLTFALPALP